MKIAEGVYFNATATSRFCTAQGPLENAELAFVMRVGAQLPLLTKKGESAKVAKDMLVRISAIRQGLSDRVWRAETIRELEAVHRLAVLCHQGGMSGADAFAFAKAIVDAAERMTRDDDATLVIHSKGKQGTGTRKRLLELTINGEPAAWAFVIYTNGRQKSEVLASVDYFFQRRPLTVVVKPDILPLSHDPIEIIKAGLALFAPNEDHPLPENIETYKRLVNEKIAEAEERYRSTSWKPHSAIKSQGYKLSADGSLAKKRKRRGKRPTRRKHKTR